MAVPANVDDLLDHEIEQLEAQVVAALPDFARTFAASRAAREAEAEMLHHQDLAHVRWLDLRAPARRALRRGRLQYLKHLRELIGEEPTPSA